MTGYFARLAARTGIGGEGSRAATRDVPPPPLATEDIVTFVTQPARPAQAPDMPSRSGEQRVMPARPPANPGPPPMPARFALPDAQASLETPAETKVRSAEGPVRAAETRPPRPDIMSTTVLPADHTGVETTVEVETRIARSAIVVPAARGVDAPTGAASRVLTAPLFQDAASAALEVIEENADPEYTARAERVAPGRPQASPLEFVAPQDREEHVSAREALAPRPANGQVHPRSQAAPSVRIGSIQVDVHAPPPPSPLPTPPPLPTPSRRASSLRRFYLRDW